MTAPRELIALIMLGYLAATSPAGAEVSASSRLQIDFTTPAKAEGQVSWSDPGNLKITSEGFGWDGEANVSRDGWIETRPLPIGMRWRPAQHARVRLRLQTGYPAVVKTENSTSFNIPSMYVRYSADKRHWSEWQPTELREVPGNTRVVEFTAVVRVARRSRQDYDDRLQDWGKRDDVNWSSDEYAFCKWLVAQEP